MLQFHKVPLLLASVLLSVQLHATALSSDELRGGLGKIQFEQTLTTLKADTSDDDELVLA